MPKHTRTAIIERLPDGSMRFRGPYVAPVVGSFKLIPHQYREYDPDDGHAWTIYPPFADAAAEIVRRHFPSVTETREEPRRSSAQPKSTVGGDPYTVLFLLPTAPAPVVDASFRALAKQYHPDHGGDASKMRAITEARDAITNRLGA